MAELKEYAHLLTTNPSGLDEFSHGDAMSQRIKEWFAHPVGSIADKPSWGHPFNSVKFEPGNPNLDAMIEIVTTFKLPKDVKGVVIHSIHIEYASIDEVHITIKHNGGDLQFERSLRAA